MHNGWLGRTPICPPDHVACPKQAIQPLLIPESPSFRGGLLSTVFTEVIRENKLRGNHVGEEIYKQFLEMVKAI